VCAGETVCPVTVSASEDSEILFIPYEKMLRSCGNACGFHTQLIENMMRLLAEKNLHLNAKLQISSKRTIRDRVVQYLYTLSRETGSTSVAIPFSRNDLADYLYVDRSALSRELGKMETDGLIRIDGRSFQILWR
jgi:CRP-like cAMP-binding protein